MPRPELSKDLVSALIALKLGKLIPLQPERLRPVRKRGLSFGDALLIILSDEVRRLEHHRFISRARKARLDGMLVFDAWDPSADITYDRHLLDELRLLRFIEQHHHVLIMGPVGVSKTMLAHSLGHLAIAGGHSVHCASVDKLFTRLRVPRSTRAGRATCGRFSESLPSNVRGAIRLAK